MSFNLAKFLFGWLTPSNPPLKADQFPPEIATACIANRNRAIRWYIAKYGTPPKVPFTAVKIVEKTIWVDGKECGAWMISPHRIEIWRHQVPFDGSLEHEFRHALCKFNGKPYGEESVR